MIDRLLHSVNEKRKQFSKDGYRKPREPVPKPPKKSSDQNPAPENNCQDILRERDSVIWKHYSRRGGIYDTLLETKNAVEHPAVNAFEFSQDAGQYIFYITLHNTCLKKWERLWQQLCDELPDVSENQKTDPALSDYTPKYDILYQKLSDLYASLQDEGEYHSLTVSPAQEQELAAYRQTAELFCTAIADIIETQAYQLQ